MSQDWSKGVLPAGHPDAMLTGRFTYRTEAHVERNPVEVCAVCGGKYRPAGGPCIHEQRSAMWAQAAGPANTRFATGSVEAARREVTGYDCRCGQCGVLWQPGHTCIRQPTEREVQSLRDEADFLQLVAATIIKLSNALRVAAPEAWEVL